MDATSMESSLQQQLCHDAVSVDDLLRLLSQEITLFQRTMYKNHSQHRRAFYFQNLQQVKRLLRDFKVDALSATFTEATAVLKQFQLQSGVHHISWKTLASELKTATDSVLRKLVAVSNVSAEVIRATQKAYKSLKVQFEMTYFMPFALMMNSVLGRMTVLFKTALVRSIELHGGVTMLYLNEVTKSNPLRAKVTAVQLQGYRIPAGVLQIANI